MRIVKRYVVFVLMLGIAIALLETGAFALDKSGMLIWPADYGAEHYWVRSLDVYSDGDPHSSGKAIDIYGEDAKGTGTVYAIAGGKLIDSYNGCSHISKSCSCGKGYGNYIKIKHDDGFYSLYAHLEKNSLTSQISVRSGDEIGRIGSSGMSTGYHLHFEIFTEKNQKDYAFDYFMNNTEYQERFLFRDGLQNRSDIYGEWIRTNYTTSFKSSSGSQYWSYSGYGPDLKNKQLDNPNVPKVTSTHEPRVCPLPPRGLRVEWASDGSAKVSWNAVSGASYRVEYNSPTSNGWKTDKDYPGNGSTSYTTTNLGAKTYRFRVCSVKGSDRSDWVEVTYVHAG